MKNDLISRSAAIQTAERMYKRCDTSSIEDYHDLMVEALTALPSAQPGCEDVVPRTSVEYICRKNTVSTNPYEHKHHDKFIQFMDDPEISDFGRWQHSNVNTALVAVKCDLDKVPSVTPKQSGWIPCSERLPEKPGQYYVSGGDKVWICEFLIIPNFIGGWCNDAVNPVVQAWMPLPKPWEGGQA